VSSRATHTSDDGCIAAYELRQTGPCASSPPRIIPLRECAMSSPSHFHEHKSASMGVVGHLLPLPCQHPALDSLTCCCPCAPHDRQGRGRCCTPALRAPAAAQPQAALCGAVRHQAAVGGLGAGAVLEGAAGEWAVFARA